MSISSYSPQLPLGVGEETNSLTVTFNRELTSSEESSFSATLYVMDGVEGDEVGWTMSDGNIDYNDSRKGTYTISGATLTISLVSNAQITAMALADD